MPIPACEELDNADNCDFVHGLMERCLARGELVIPMLPEIALRVVRIASGGDGNAESLAEVVSCDPALTSYVLRVATSAGRGPGAEIGSVQQAVAWLGFDEVANISFTLALQGKILDIPGQHHRARQLWRHALASGLWSKRIASMLAHDTGMPYLCGLLHDVGRLVGLGAVHDLARRAQVKLTREEYDRLIETFNHAIGIRVAGAWGLPAAVQAAAAQWQSFASADAARFECTVVNLAHRLADAGVTPSAMPLDLLLGDPAYLDLGLRPADGAALFEGGRSINAELDRYLTP